MQLACGAEKLEEWLIKLPLQPTEHQYFVTDTIDEIKNLNYRLPSVADRDGEYYLRQEGKGLLIGAYEKIINYVRKERPQMILAMIFLMMT